MQSDESESITIPVAEIRLQCVVAQRRWHMCPNLCHLEAEVGKERHAQREEPDPLLGGWNG